MADIELVIKIQEDIYKDIIENGFIYDEDNEIVTDVIKNAMPLPKWHGDLIDRSETLRTDRFSDGHEGLKTIQEYAVYAKIRRYLQSLPAIIPAEKE